MSDLHAWGDPDHMSRPEPERAAAEPCVCLTAEDAAALARVLNVASAAVRMDRVAFRIHANELQVGDLSRLAALIEDE